MIVPLSERAITRYERQFRARQNFAVPTILFIAVWISAVVWLGAFFGVLGYDGFVSITYRHNNGVALYGGPWYYVGLAPVLVLAALPLVVYQFSRVDVDNVLIGGPGLAPSIGIMHGFLLLAVASLILGGFELLTPLLTDTEHLLLHRSRRVHPPRYWALALSIALAVLVPALYHRYTLSRTFQGLSRMIGWTGFAALLVLVASLLAHERIRPDALAMRSAIFLASTVFCQALALYTIHLGRWPDVLDAFGRGYCLKCGYDLRGTLAADRTECPECGARVNASRGAYRGG